LGVWGSGVSKICDFYSKRHMCSWIHVVLGHFASKSVEGCDLQVGWGKNPESHRGSHRKDMSPLTQGLNCRSACDFVHDLDLSMPCDVIGHVTIRFSICSFLLALHSNQAFISKRFRDIWLQIYVGHDLDLSGHVTSLGMWPFDTTYSISCRRSIVTDSVSPVVFEILCPKNIGVTTLTFQCHVTS